MGCGRVKLLLAGGATIFWFKITKTLTSNLLFFKQMQIPKFLKIIATILGTIVLGAIGSGVWERVLSPLLNSISNFITATLSKYSASFSDALYADAITRFEVNSFNSNINTFALTYLLILVPFLFYLNNKGLLKIAVRALFESGIGHAMTILLLSLLIFNTSRSSSISQINRYIHKNLEIARPYIGEQKYIELRSDYFRITDKNGFDQFENKLIKLASDKNITINKYSEK